ncbi:hypothetical protein GQ55_4G298100 [Panicum hallii var. hallii]|uniref:Uncharacterized protein n=1 Tax=Panicum hallii var. hallii TaxID=1504633 RepID=A0A2T7E1L6_9POAL|nr:hypothetical protein GQ55_4G298100 [Panicum hallii var. hallii]
MRDGAYQLRVPDEHRIRGSKLRDGDKLRACRTAAARQNVQTASRRPGSFWRSTVTILHERITRRGRFRSDSSAAGGGRSIDEHTEGFRLRIMQSSEERTMAAGTHQQALAAA